MNKLTVFLTVLLFTLGCASRTEVSVEYIEDAGTSSSVSSDAAFTPYACDESTVSVDFRHCGVCGNACSIDDADHCAGGQCLCGPTASCASGSDCYGELCIPADPDGENCEFTHQCPATYACIEGHCTSIDCQPETCDGVDNDCDGDVDEASLGVPLTSTCGPPTTEGPCRRGYQICVDGGWSICHDAVWPVDESGLLACDGIDNDCDGCVDGSIRDDGLCERREAASFDVVFILDISGSMSGVLDQVKTATASFSAMFATDLFRYAIVTTGSSFTTASAVPELLLDLSDYSTFDAALSLVTVTGGGYEPTWDAPYDVATGAMGVSWRDGAARIIIEFTDEEGQTYRVPGIDEAAVCASPTRGELFVFFSRAYHSHDYDDCGLWFNVLDYENILPNLTGVIGDPCT